MEQLSLPTKDKGYKLRYEHLLRDYRYAIAFLSHELRNPLTLIQSSLQLMEDHHPEVSDFDYWNDILGDVSYMTKLLNDISDYTNGSSLKITKVNINRLLESLIVSFRDSKRQIYFYTQSKLPLFDGDCLKLKQVFWNLLKNSIEATPINGRIEVRTAFHENKIRIKIADNGCGISKDMENSLFQPFSTSKTTGTGLGLSISRKIIYAHKGTIECHKNKWNGTTFSIVLPYVPSITTAQMETSDLTDGSKQSPLLH